MVRITEDLVRKKAEHNEGIIGTLEELSLHQEDIEKIEHLNNWCKGLQILYLQANLIPKIENLNKLKKLEYLNLAINNIEKVENLNRCEFLQKLDLTINFIGDLESVCSLQENVHLKHLYLTGNPCCEYDGYREYVIAKLPQLQTLDGVEIAKSERIKASQNIDRIEERIKEAQLEYRRKRQEQRKRGLDKNTLQQSDEEFWKSTSEHSPEARIEIAQRTSRARQRNDNNNNNNNTKKTRIVTLFNKDGRPLNVNQAKLNFTLKDDNPKKLILDIEVYRYLDTSLIDVDIQPIYIKITIKDKIFQIVLPEEIEVDNSTAKRSQTTGHLLIEMPRVRPVLTKKITKTDKQEKENKLQKPKENFLEVEEIGGNNKKFKDNPDVPPLEYA